jgi:AcrR family transcriptional regulator
VPLLMFAVRDRWWSVTWLVLLTWGRYYEPASASAIENAIRMKDTKHKFESVSQHRDLTQRDVQRRDMESKDERVRRTRARIDAAFVDLLHRRAYADIRVSDIVKKAHIGRPTFYAHYATKDALLRSQFERIVAPMFAASSSDPALLDATHFFAHVGTAPDLYMALMGPNGGAAPRLMRECAEARIRQVLALDDANASGLKRAAAARFVASSLMAIIECWLEQGARESPQQVQTLFANLVTPGLRSLNQR